MEVQNKHNRTQSQEEEESISLTVVRGSDLQQKKFIITPKGTIGSLRKNQSGECLIGRQNVSDQGKYQNDIVLTSQDRAMSRQHCKIVYKWGFSKRQIPDSWVMFLLAYHPRCGKFSHAQILPKCIFRHILEFIKEPQCFWLIDMGSVSGTYIKLEGNEPVELKQGQSFIVGNSVSLNVEEVQCDEIETIPTTESEDITGLSYQNNTLPSATLPRLKIEVHTQPDEEDQTLHSESYSFIAEDRSKVFLIGRAAISDVAINDHTISRVQARVKYEKGRWLLWDGSWDKPSANGTWLGVSQYKRNGEKKDSEPAQIRNGHQIKISEFVLQVQFNGLKQLC